MGVKNENKKHQENDSELFKILKDLKRQTQVRKLNLLKEKLQQRRSLEEANRWRKENKRLTDVGIGLHKQGRIIDRLLNERFITRMDQVEEVFDEESVLFISEDKLDMLKSEVVKGEMVEQMIDKLEPLKHLL